VRREPYRPAQQHACPPEWCPGPEAYEEIKAELLGLSYAEDLQLMAEFGRAVLGLKTPIRYADDEPTCSVCGGKGLP